jgi:hypothetical protein
MSISLKLPNIRSFRIPGQITYCNELTAPAEVSRTEMSMPPHLIAWKSIDAGCLYVISRCVGVSQFSFRSTPVAFCDSCKTSILSCRPFTCLRVTVDSMPAVPGPPYWSVWAEATQRPSGEPDSVDHIIAASLQPDTRTHLINNQRSNFCETGVAQGVSAGCDGRPLGSDRRTVGIG